MSVTSAMYTGISGLYTNGEAMSVIGNNISNVNTVGFKQSRALFSDMLSTTVARGQVGRGEQIQAIENIFSQGSFESTESSTDLAVQGEGMFVLQGKGGMGRFYSRAGAFSFNKDKILTNPDGYEVLGYGIRNGASNGVLGTIDLSTFSNTPPRSTTNIEMVANLDATQTTPADTWDPTLAGFNPIQASNFSTSTTVYDALGNTKSLSLYFRKTGANAWEVNSYDGSSYTPAGGGVPFTFDPVNGSLATVNGTATTTVPFPTMNIAGMTVDLRGTTQYTSSSIMLSQTQDGYPAGNLMKIAIDENGYVNGNYSNGQLQRIAQIALARFASPTGLEKLGGSLFSETVSSGSALIDSTSVINNKIFSNSLEQSNVDMAGQLVKMITTQRAYSAASKTITTADDMLQEALNLKR